MGKVFAVNLGPYYYKIESRDHLSLCNYYCTQGNIRNRFILAPFALVSGQILDWTNYSYIVSL